MGKFSFSFSKTVLPHIQMHGNGVNFTTLNQVISAIPGETVLTAIEENIVLDIITVRGENHFLLDDTEIVVKYKNQSRIGSSGNGTIIYPVFDGIDIIDPPLPGYTINPTYTVPVSGMYNVTKTNTTVSSIHSNGSKIYFNPGTGGPITPHIPAASGTIPTCECGKEKHGFATHANWCSIKDNK